MYRKIVKNKLVFNRKTQIIKGKQTINYLGWNYRFHNNQLMQTITKQNKKRVKKYIRQTVFEYRNGMIDSSVYISKIQSIINHLHKGNTYRYIKSITKYQKNNQEKYI